MKKLNIGACLLTVFCCLLFGISSMYGCGSSGTVATTTTTVVTTTSVTTTTTNNNNSTSVQQQVASAGLIVKGSSAIGASVGAMGATGGMSGCSIFDVKAFSGASEMPDQFWTIDMVNTTEARIPITFSGTIAGMISPSMRFWLQNGNLLCGANVASTEGKYHKIAKLGNGPSAEACTTEVLAILNSGQGGSPAWLIQGMFMFSSECQATMIANMGNVAAVYASSECFFQSIRTMGEYIGWVSVMPNYNSQLGQSIIKMTTPEAVTAYNRLATIEVFMTFNAPVTGDANFLILTKTTEAGGCPLAGTYYDTAALLTPAGTLDATVGMIFSATDAYGTTFTGITLRGVITPEGHTMAASMNSAGTSGSIIMSDEAGTTMGTGEVSATGVTWYPSGIATKETILWNDI